eukprot:236522-Pelagomonas_calceolata.AAC.1
MCNGMLRSNSETLRRVLKVDLNIRSREPSCWTAQGTPIPIQEITDDLRHRSRTVWRDVEGVNPRETYSELETYQSIFAVPFDHNVRAPARLPRHVHLDLSQHVVRNVSCFRFRAHTHTEGGDSGLGYSERSFV